MKKEKKTREKKTKINTNNNICRVVLTFKKENLLVDDPYLAYFPPIFNIDPITSAHELTIEDGKIAYKYMKAMYNDLANNKFSSSFLEEAIFYSKNSFNFYATFFRELEKILPADIVGLGDAVIPFELEPKVTSKTNEMYLPAQSPLTLTEVEGGKYRVKYKSFGSRNYTNARPIILNRLNYIMKAPDLDEYIDGFPSWYRLPTKKTIVFEKYSPQLNKRIRIDWDNQQFYYYIAGSSDNWQRIHNVPIEIDDVVAILMFRKS